VNKFWLTVVSHSHDFGISHHTKRLKITAIVLELPGLIPFDLITTAVNKDLAT
jgi:hypothetical protein